MEKRPMCGRSTGRSSDRGAVTGKQRKRRGNVTESRHSTLHEQLLCAPKKEHHRYNARPPNTAPASFCKQAAAATAAAITVEPTDIGFLQAVNPISSGRNASSLQNSNFNSQQTQAENTTNRSIDIDGFPLVLNKSSSAPSYASYAIGPSDFDTLFDQSSPGREILAPPMESQMRPKSCAESQVRAFNHVDSPSMKLSYALRTVIDSYMSQQARTRSEKAHYGSNKIPHDVDMQSEQIPKIFQISKSLNDERIFPKPTMLSSSVDQGLSRKRRESSGNISEMRTKSSPDDVSLAESIGSIDSDTIPPKHYPSSNVDHLQNVFESSPSMKSSLKDDNPDMMPLKILSKSSRVSFELKGELPVEIANDKSLQLQQQPDNFLDTSGTAEADNGSYPRILDGLQLTPVDIQILHDSKNVNFAKKGRLDDLAIVKLQQEEKQKKEIQLKKLEDERTHVSAKALAFAEAEALQESVPIVPSRRQSLKSLAHEPLPANEAMPQESMITLHVPDIDNSSSIDALDSTSLTTQRNLASLRALRRSQSPVSAGCSRQTSPSISRSNSLLLHPLSTDAFQPMPINPSSISREGSSRASAFKYAASMRTRSHDVLDEVGGDGLGEDDLVPLPQSPLTSSSGTPGTFSPSPKRAVAVAMKRANSQVLSRDSSLMSLSRKVSEDFNSTRSGRQKSASVDSGHITPESQKGAGSSYLSPYTLSSAQVNVNVETVAHAVNESRTAQESHVTSRDENSSDFIDAGGNPTSSHTRRIDVLRKERKALQNALADVKARLGDYGCIVADQEDISPDGTASISHILSPPNITDLVSSAEVQPTLSTQTNTCHTISTVEEPAPKEIVDAPVGEQPSDTVLGESVECVTEISATKSPVTETVVDSKGDTVLPKGMEGSNNGNNVATNLTGAGTFGSILKRKLMTNAMKTTPSFIKMAGSVDEIDDKDSTKIITNIVEGTLDTFEKDNMTEKKAGSLKMVDASAKVSAVPAASQPLPAHDSPESPRSPQPELNAAPALHDEAVSPLNRSALNVRYHISSKEEYLQKGTAPVPGSRVRVPLYGKVPVLSSKQNRRVRTKATKQSKSSKTKPSTLVVETMRSGLEGEPQSEELRRDDSEKVTPNASSPHFFAEDTAKIETSSSLRSGQGGSGSDLGNASPRRMKQRSSEQELGELEMNLKIQQQSSEEYQIRKKMWGEFKTLTALIGKELKFDQLHKHRLLGKVKFASVYRGAIRLNRKSMREVLQHLRESLNSQAHADEERSAEHDKIEGRGATGEGAQQVNEKTTSARESAFSTGGKWTAAGCDNIVLKICHFKGNDTEEEVIYSSTRQVVSSFVKNFRSRRSINNALSDLLDPDPPPPMGPITDFFRELEALHALSEQPNIVKLEGVIYKPLAFALELMDNNLAHFLDDTEWQLGCNMEMKLKILTDVAAGLSCMHEKLFIHRDIQPMNILVSMVPISGEGSDPPSGRLSDPPRSPMRMAENFVAVAKLAEFGSTVKLKDGNDVLHQPSGTPGYSAPEMHLAGRYGLPVDVFSFGMIAWELFSQHHHDNPVKGLPAYAAAEKIDQEVRPEFGPEHASFIKETAQRCWATNYHIRPSIGDVMKALQYFTESDDNFVRIYDKNYAKAVFDDICPQPVYHHYTSGHRFINTLELH